MRGSPDLTHTICELFFIQGADKSALIDPSYERWIDDETRIGLFCLGVMSGKYIKCIGNHLRGRCWHRLQARNGVLIGHSQQRGSWIRNWQRFRCSFMQQCCTCQPGVYPVRVARNCFGVIGGDSTRTQRFAKIRSLFHWGPALLRCWSH